MPDLGSGKEVTNAGGRKGRDREVKRALEVQALVECAGVAAAQRLV